MKIYAHRGYSGKYPENTLLAFQKAVKFGADGVELDVHLTKDKKIVVCHDESIDRTYNGHGLISEMTFEELRRYDFQGERLPTLEEVFDLVGENFPVNVELKTDVIRSDELVERVVEFVNSNNPGRVLISSFNHDSLVLARKLDGDLRLGLLFGEKHIDIIDRCMELSLEIGAFSYNLPISSVGMNGFGEFAGFARNHGIKIVFWTVNTNREIELAVENDPYIIITNELELVKSAVKR